MLILKINHLDANVAYSMVQVYYGLATGLIQQTIVPCSVHLNPIPLLYFTCSFVFAVVIYVNNRIPSRKVIRGKSHISTTMDRRGLFLLTFLWMSATTKVIDGDYQLAPLSPNRACTTNRSDLSEFSTPMETGHGYLSRGSINRETTSSTTDQ